jgi:hypothetical protein
MQSPTAAARTSLCVNVPPKKCDAQSHDGRKIRQNMLQNVQPPSHLLVYTQADIAQHQGQLQIPATAEKTKPGHHITFPRKSAMLCHIMLGKTVQKCHISKTNHLARDCWIFPFAY